VLRSSRGSKYSRRLLIAVAAALIPMIAGCEAGYNAPSLHWHDPTDGTGATIGNITVSDAFVLGAPLGAELRTGQNAGLFLGLTNIGTPDKLTSITAPGVAASVRLPGGRITLATNNSVLLTGPRPDVILEHLLRPLSAGTDVTIYLTFAQAGIRKLIVPVIPRSQYFATLLPAPAPTSPKATKTTKTTKTTKPSPGTSKSPSSSPTPTTSS
jgi:copper(I)-binding protein